MLLKGRLCTCVESETIREIKKTESESKEESNSDPRDWNRSLHLMNNVFGNDGNMLGRQSLAKEEVGTFSAASESPRLLEQRFEPTKKSTGPISALKELCTVEGLGLAFQTQPQLSAPGQKNELYAQVMTRTAKQKIKTRVFVTKQSAQEAEAQGNIE